MARQCTQPKRPRNSAWFKEKMVLVQAYEFGQELDEEQLAFQADLGIPNGQAIQTTILQMLLSRLMIYMLMVSLQQKRFLWLIFLVTIQTSSLR
ncbi:hypothetical protein Tco_1041017 [Tanacetum coccineum]|uniref:Uncharacterized protein n=1 Tax=Tanacetum coccineum TaxID=301880 RepID=A0ABQ5GH77_9ASTR